MKKFLIFLMSIVIVVCVGLTTYYFMRNNEIITIKTREIYCNAGDTIPLDSLGISIERANVSKKTSFNYNAGGEDVTKYIEYNAERKAFIVSLENAGDVTLVISTTNKKYPDFNINVHIGNGTKENPYYIFNESELSRIGSIYRLDSHYRLMNDITLTSEFKPIGYNSTTSTWDGFSGNFDGQGHTLKGFKAENVESQNMGLFTSINASGSVKNLVIENANIVGSHQNVGVLAGVVDGNVEKVAIKNSTISNNLSNSSTGSFAGKLSGNAKLTYAENVEINVGTEENPITDAVVGGFAGIINQSLIQASYANNVQINLANTTAVLGGFAGKFIISTENGSIQQSYANTICANENFGAFIGSVETTNFDVNNANMLRHFIGNIAVVYGVGANDITDNKLVKSYDATFFKNSTYVDRSVFFEKDSALYMIRGFASAGEVITTNEFVYYAIDMNNVTSWDTEYVWNVSNNSLPTLRFGNIYPEAPSGEYFRRDLTQVDMGNKETFVDKFKANVENQNIKLLEDVDLSSGWTPVSIKNTTFDGNGKTITINLNNSVENNLGLFTTVDNSTIKNLNIVVVNVNANATNAGALAGIITSTDALTNSTIENVTITYQNFANGIITNFGGIAGTVNNANVKNCKVVGLNMTNNSSTTNAAGLVATLNEGATIENCAVENVVVNGTTSASGVVAMNNGSIVNILGNADVVLNSTATESYVAGVVAINAGSINNIKLTTNVKVINVGTSSYVAGAVAKNDGTVANVEISGNNVNIIVETQNPIYVGGVVSINNGTIESVVNNIANVGTYHNGANANVGGVAAINNGTIQEVVTQSNLAGNKVAGVVVEMNNTNAVIDQVMVGKFNATSRKLEKIELKGDKYLAGLVVDFRLGTITNVQSASNIYGETNTTRSSLVTLIFPYGATIKNVTVDSSMTGYGVRYRESWTDFAAYSNKAEFGLANGSTGDERFNIYKYDSFHGVMQSVVINRANEGVSGAKAAMGSAFAWTKDYQDTAESSYIKVVDGFNDVAQFQGKFTFVCAKSTLFGIKHEATKTLTFEIGNSDIWKSNDGIILNFVNELIPYVAE